ncbi:TM2 domain-containing protein [Myxococcota bacterium]|nr:TM2 domain-containing protein [Myxococcota bacterium]
MDPTPSTERPDRLTTLLLCLFLGSFGVHRFYTGHHGVGLVQLVSLGGCGAWWALDVLALARGTFADAEGHVLT